MCTLYTHILFYIVVRRIVLLRMRNDGSKAPAGIHLDNLREEENSMSLKYWWRSSEITAYPTIHPFIFEWLWLLPDRNFQKGKCLTNDISRFQRMIMCRSFVALTRHAFVQTSILPSFTNTKKQHIYIGNGLKVHLFFT